jgi:O-antigen ligase
MHSIWVISVPEVVHNMFLEIAVETGILGLLMLMGVIWISFKNFKYAHDSFFKKGEDEMALLLKGMWIGFFGLMVAALFLSIQSFFVLWTVMGLGVVAKNLAKDGDVYDS